MEDYYKIFEVSINSSDKRIYRIFKRNVFPIHPDNIMKIGNNKKKFIRYCSAYYIIGDADNRNLYDLFYKNKNEQLEIEYSEEEINVSLENWKDMGKDYAENDVI